MVTTRKAIALGVALLMIAGAASADTGDRIDDRLDKRGDRIEDRLVPHVSSLGGDPGRTVRWHRAAAHACEGGMWTGLDDHVGLRSGHGFHVLAEADCAADVAHPVVRGRDLVAGELSGHIGQDGQARR